MCSCKLIEKYIVRSYSPTTVVQMEQYINDAHRKEHLELVSVTNSGCGTLMLVFRRMMDRCM